MTVLVFIVLLQSRPRNLPLCSLTAAATLLVRSSLLSVIMSLDIFSQYFYCIFLPHLVTLCWAVKAQGQGHRRDRVARCEHSLRSSGITLESIRRSEIIMMIDLIICFQRMKTYCKKNYSTLPELIPFPVTYFCSMPHTLQHTLFNFN